MSDRLSRLLLEGKAWYKFVALAPLGWCLPAEHLADVADAPEHSVEHFTGVEHCGPPSLSELPRRV